MRVKDPEWELILVPAGSEKQIIRILHEGVEAAHKAAKAKAAKIILLFYWREINRDTKL